MSSFGGAYGKTTRDYVNAAKDAIVTMVEVSDATRRSHQRTCEGQPGDGR